MPRIDEDDSSSESDDIYTAPRRPAAPAYKDPRKVITSTSYKPPTQQKKQPTAAKKRRIVEDDDEEDDSVPASRPGILSVPPPKFNVKLPSNEPPRASDSAPSRSKVVDVSSSDEDIMQAPVAKRIMPAPLPISSAAANRAAAKPEKRFYSDDEDDSEEDNVLSYSEESEPPEIITVDDSPTRPAPAKVSYAEKADKEEPETPPPPRKRGRPPGKKNAPKVPTAKAAAPAKTPKKSGTKKSTTSAKQRFNDDMSEDEDDYFEDEMMDLDEDEDVMVLEDEESEEYDENGEVLVVDDAREKKMTKRQRALVGGDEESASEHLELADTKGKVAIPFIEVRRRAALNAPTARKPFGTPKTGRTQPPNDTLEEVNQIVSQLMRRDALDKVEVKRNLKDTPMFNPWMTKNWSRLDGNYLTVPLAYIDQYFPPQDGWSPAISQQDAKDIPIINVKRGLLDPA